MTHHFLCVRWDSDDVLSDKECHNEKLSYLEQDSNIIHNDKVLQ